MVGGNPSRFGDFFQGKRLSDIFFDIVDGDVDTGDVVGFLIDAHLFMIVVVLFSALR